MQIYYCYTCLEYFKISPKKAKKSDSIICPQCGSFDTEHSPEEENNPDTSKYAQAIDGSDEDNNDRVNDYDVYIEEVEGVEDQDR